MKAVTTKKARLLNAIEKTPQQTLTEISHLADNFDLERVLSKLPLPDMDKV
jgi:hypothetical protein